MKIMITGLSGNLSSALIKSFPDNEFKFNSKDCTFSKTEVPFTYNIKYKKELDIRKRKLIDKYMQYKPDIIIHTAAYVNTNRCEEDTVGAFKTNVEGTFNLVDSMCKYSPDSLFVNLCTTATMDPSCYSLEKRLTETTKQNPQTWYGQTKILAEEIVKRRCKRWINLFPVFLFGNIPLDSSSMVNITAYNTMHNKTTNIKLDPKIYKMWEYVYNFVPVLRNIILNKQSENQDIVIAGNSPKTFQQFLDICEDKFKTIFDKKLIYTLEPKGDYLKNHIADNSKMLRLANMTEKQFNENRITFEQGIEESYKCLKKLLSVELNTMNK